TRTGLPPTPIAMPGAASLQAALQPAAVKSLYFVARGDGSSEFSDDLAAHNRAVNKYIRGK
ncbi:endolytic transglycosylase MltG, partial [Acinetobacter baumannii]